MMDMQYHQQNNTNIFDKDPMKRGFELQLFQISIYTSPIITTSFT